MNDGPLSVTPPPESDPPNADDGKFASNGQDVIWYDTGTEYGQDPFTPEHLAELDARNRAARQLAPTLIGLTISEARRVVDEHPDLSIVFRDPFEPYPPVGVFGQIDAVVRADVVIAVE